MVDCELDDGDGVDDQWRWAVTSEFHPGDAVERRFDTDYPDGRPLAMSYAAWVTENGQFALVQVGGDAIREPGTEGAYGCCVEDEDLEPPDPGEAE